MPRQYRSTWQPAAAPMAAADTHVWPMSKVMAYRPSAVARTAEGRLPGRRHRLPDGSLGCLELNFSTIESSIRQIKPPDTLVI